MILYTKRGFKWSIKCFPEPERSSNDYQRLGRSGKRIESKERFQVLNKVLFALTSNTVKITIFSLVPSFPFLSDVERLQAEMEPCWIWGREDLVCAQRKDLAARYSSLQQVGKYEILNMKTFGNTTLCISTVSFASKGKQSLKQNEKETISARTESMKWGLWPRLSWSTQVGNNLINQKKKL